MDKQHNFETAFSQVGTSVCLCNCGKTYYEESCEFIDQAELNQLQDSVALRMKKRPVNYATVRVIKIIVMVVI